MGKMPEVRALTSRVVVLAAVSRPLESTVKIEIAVELPYVPAVTAVLASVRAPPEAMVASLDKVTKVGTPEALACRICAEVPAAETCKAAVLEPYKIPLVVKLEAPVPPLGTVRAVSRVRPPLNRPVPMTCRVELGLVVPIPTLPPVVARLVLLVVIKVAVCKLPVLVALEKVKSPRLETPVTLSVDCKVTAPEVCKVLRLVLLLTVSAVEEAEPRVV